jgi:hypothetical protein
MNIAEVDNLSAQKFWHNLINSGRGTHKTIPANPERLAALDRGPIGDKDFTGFTETAKQNITTTLHEKLKRLSGKQRRTV